MLQEALYKRPPVFTPVNESTLHKGGVRGILLYLQDWRDEIPNKIVHSHSRPRKVKARHGWFSNIIMATTIAMDLGKVTDPALIAHADEFATYYSSHDFTSRLTLPTDITRGNELLNRFVEAIPSARRQQRKLTLELASTGARRMSV